MYTVSNEMILSFKQCLLENERATATVDKYLRDVNTFVIWLAGRLLHKSLVLDYKKYLSERYAVRSVNSILSSLNAFFSFLNRNELRVKTLKVQREIFSSSDKELSKTEYERLLSAAKSKKNERLYLLIQTICATGIRISELRFITCEAIANGYADVNNKGKRRRVFIPRMLCKMLAVYVKDQKIKKGSVFVTKNGKPLDRSNVWSDMKKLAKSAHVSASKVFPHNLRHLFARTYYSVQKDIVRLADLLGHTSINTTRIYTVESGEIHRRHIERLGLLRC